MLLFLFRFPSCVAGGRHRPRAFRNHVQQDKGCRLYRILVFRRSRDSVQEGHPRNRSLGLPVPTDVVGVGGTSLGTGSGVAGHDDGGPPTWTGCFSALDRKGAFTERARPFEPRYNFYNSFQSCSFGLTSFSFPFFILPKLLEQSLTSFSVHSSLVSFQITLSAVVDGHCSDPKPVNSGVPQGSALFYFSVVY